MYSRRLFPLLCPLVLTAAQCASGTGDRLTGSWGGEGAGLVVSGDRTLVSYTCGQTTINGPVLIDDDRRFEVSGEHVRVGGAPPPSDAPADRRPAYVTGRLRGNELTLSVRLAESTEAIGAFVLTRDRTPSILGCP